MLLKKFYFSHQMIFISEYSFFNTEEKFPTINSNNHNYGSNGKLFQDQEGFTWFLH